MSEASQAAIRAAEQLGLDINAVEGTGKDGLVTKGDVEAAAEANASTNIMDKMKLERAKAATHSIPEVTSEVIDLPSQEELLNIIKEMRGEIEDLREQQAGLIERESHSRDLTDDMFFIAKPGAHRWEERRVVDNKTVNIEFVGTGFYGPFASKEDIQSYLDAKGQKRADSYIDWENVKTMTGREARQLDADETAARESQFASNAPVNVLDRRIFAANHTGHVPGMGQASPLAQGEETGPAPFGYASGRQAR